MREPQKTKDGKEYLLVTYPKYKFGEVVQEIRVPPRYSKYGYFFRTFSVATVVVPNHDLWKMNGSYRVLPIVQGKKMQGWVSGCYTEKPSRKIMGKWWRTENPVYHFCGH